MTMAKTLMAVAIVSPGGWNGDAAVAPARIEKVDLRMENVSARYGGRQLVDGMSMSVRRGAVVGLLDTNGARKVRSRAGRGSSVSFISDDARDYSKLCMN